MLAMRRAVEGLRLKPAKVLVDGNRIPVLDVRAEAVVGGDALVAEISAASILAKVHRDRWCAELDVQYPHYGFAVHKGYGTPRHLAALRQFGACPEHRRSFSPVAEVLDEPPVAPRRMAPQRVAQADDDARQVIEVHSRDNDVVKVLRRLSGHNTAYRKHGRFWVEGDHLCRAALDRGLVPALAVFAQSFWSGAGAPWDRAALRSMVVPDALFASFSGLESSANWVSCSICRPAWRRDRVSHRWFWTGCRTRAMSARSCAAPRRSASSRCCRCRAARRCGRPRCCALAWGPISDCIWSRPWKSPTSWGWACR